MPAAEVVMMILTTDQRWKRVSEGYGKGKMESTQLLHTRTVGLVHENTAAEVVTSVCSQRWCGLQSYLVFTTFANFNPAKHFFLCFQEVVQKPSFMLNRSCAAVKGVRFLEERGSKAVGATFFH